MENKTAQGYVTKTDEALGIVTCIFSVFGIVDEGNDVVHDGAFAKTFVERGGKIRVLDLHRTDTVLRAIGKPMSLREIPRSELPKAILDQYPDATGGAEAVVQFLLETPEGKGAFIRIKEEVITEWSFAYDALDYDFTTVEQGGQSVTIRHLRTVKLYELSPVIWGMNSATMTVDAKGAEDNEPLDVEAMRKVVTDLAAWCKEITEVFNTAGVTLQEYEAKLAVVRDTSETSPLGASTKEARPPTAPTSDAERERLKLLVLLEAVNA